MLRGALAAALTPLREGGAALDEEAWEPYCAFLAAGGLDGLPAHGTTGEGILLSVVERRRAAELFVAGPLPVIVHCGAQTTADTVALAEHAASIGAAGVAVIGPPYFVLDEDALLAHLSAAARACAPLPFYVYEFRPRAGYSVSPALLERLGEQVENLRGLKVSNKPWAAVEPYLIEGLDVFVGAEELVVQGLERGSAGAVSGLAAAFPDLVARLVHDRADGAGRVRDELERFPFHAALKAVVAARGVPLREDVRAPLRQLTPDEHREHVAWLASS